MAFEPRVRACFEIKALSQQEGWLPFKDLATQRSEQGRMRGDVKTMRDRLPDSITPGEGEEVLIGIIVYEGIWDHELEECVTGTPVNCRGWKFKLF